MSAVGSPARFVARDDLPAEIGSTSTRRPALERTGAPAGQVPRGLVARPTPPGVALHDRPAPPQILPDGAASGSRRAGHGAPST